MSGILKSASRWRRFASSPGLHRQVSQHLQAPFTPQQLLTMCRCNQRCRSAKQWADGFLAAQGIFLSFMLDKGTCDLQGVSADFLTRNEQYVNASAEHRPKQV